MDILVSILYLFEDHLGFRTSSCQALPGATYALLCQSILFSSASEDRHLLCQSNKSILTFSYVTSNNVFDVSSIINVCVKESSQLRFCLAGSSGVRLCVSSQKRPLMKASSCRRRRPPASKGRLDPPFP